MFIPKCATLDISEDWMWHLEVARFCDASLSEVYGMYVWYWHKEVSPLSLPETSPDPMVGRVLAEMRGEIKPPPDWAKSRKTDLHKEPQVSPADRLTLMDCLFATVFCIGLYAFICLLLLMGGQG
jgi:hypothetical protein